MSATVSKITRFALAAAIAASGAVATTAVTLPAAHAATAAASSAVNGDITRGEILDRARFWYGKSIGYNQGGSYPDSSGRNYRTDCSGYVSMAWHLNESRNTRTLPDVSHEISRSELRPGDILNSYYNHVILFEKWDDAAHTTFSYYSFGSTPVAHRTGVSINAAKFDSHPNGEYKALRYDRVLEGAPSTSYPNPASLATGTLIKTPDAPDVKVMINGAGLYLAGGDVAPGGYNLGAVVTVDAAAFHALPTSPASGTVVHDQAGGNGRWVVVNGAALPIAGPDWVAAGYNQRADLGVPSSWLAGARGNTLPAGTVVHDQAGGNDRYVMVAGAALPISGAEWTADGYNERPDLGVPGGYLAAAKANTVPTGTVMTGQGNGDPSVYVIVSGSALPLTYQEFSSYGYSDESLMGAPETWLAAAAARPLPNGTVVKNVSGADPSVYVMAGGAAVPLSGADYTGLGYSNRSLMGVPGTWLGGAAAKPAPADGTLVKHANSPTIWQISGGKRKALTADQFGPGKLSFDDVLNLPVAYVNGIPTTA
ncbi:hypothetical protein OHV05_06565 [Kitasatospora sp. NBC_00070]|uniref:hypothetical protein n=1 Tax=Kitasatospora sp. NBC_00070 TaxID=2975962 RepID=UPI00324949FD